ncbi:MAG: DUF1800 domain-containing protein [Cyanobacteriota bacterium]|nr:DUF1800 domain-containing protein [Cyanobacteriota bacterium]
MDAIRQKGHFYRRASFGATLDELEANVSPQTLLEGWLQAGSQSIPSPQLPMLPPLNRERDPASQKQLRLLGGQFATGLLEQMVTATNPLHERITTIWRDHFVVGTNKFNIPHFLRDYEIRLRTFALGDFRDLLWSVTTSPAMMLYLDNQQNRQGKLNENYSRELLELFTVGQGNYTEQDIQEGSRALTGWTINFPKAALTGEVESLFVARRHDGGSKTYLGHMGNLATQDVVDILANSPHTARRISSKLWSEWVYPNPEPEIVTSLAGVYQAHQRQLAYVVEAIFSHPAFYSERAYRSRLKGPLAFVVGSIRQLQLQADYGQVLRSLAFMGQRPYGAPTVKGWPSDSGWLNAVALLDRLNLAQQMTQDNGDEGKFRYDPANLNPQAVVRLLLDGETPSGSLPSLDIRDLTALLLASPTYQLA